MARRKKPTFDPQTLVADIDHRDDELLADIAKQNAILDRWDNARLRGNTAVNRVVRETCDETLALGKRINTTPAVTREGRLQKAMLAMRSAGGDPDEPCGGFGGFGSGALSALHDILAAGML